MRTDRELIELAAKAAGLKEFGWMADTLTHVVNNQFVFWDPLADDGDALRLAVRLSIVLSPSKQTIIAWVPGAVDRDKVCVILQPDPESATRRAIVLAAAEIGATMP